MSSLELEHLAVLHAMKSTAGKLRVFMHRAQGLLDSAHGKMVTGEVSPANALKTVNDVRQLIGEPTLAMPAAHAPMDDGA